MPSVDGMITRIFVILIVCFAAIALADDFKTINGKEYKDVEVIRVEPDGIMLKSKSGISKVYFTELPKEVQERFHYEASKATSYSAAQNAATDTTNEQLAKEQNIQALRVSLQQLQNAKEDLQREIAEKENLPKRLSWGRGHHYDNPDRADLPDLKERLFNVTQEIGRLTNRLHKLENGY